MGAAKERRADVLEQAQTPCVALGTMCLLLAATLPLPGVVDSLPCTVAACSPGGRVSGQPGLKERAFSLHSWAGGAESADGGTRMVRAGRECAWPSPLRSLWARGTFSPLHVTPRRPSDGSSSN